MNVFTITTGGVTPQNMTLPAGSRVTFINRDSRDHQMSSDPHPDHDDCPELNQIGFLAPNQSRESGNLVQARTCGFHDHLNPGTRGLQGAITIR
jgi:hypothetical protein